jgi:hypothetical protein
MSQLSLQLSDSCMQGTAAVGPRGPSPRGVLAAGVLLSFSLPLALSVLDVCGLDRGVHVAGRRTTTQQKATQQQQQAATAGSSSCC